MYLRAISEYKLPGVYIRRYLLLEVFLRFEFGGRIFRGAYWPNFTVIIAISRCCRHRTFGCLQAGVSAATQGLSPVEESQQGPSYGPRRSSSEGPSGNYASR